MIAELNLRIAIGLRLGLFHKKLLQFQCLLVGKVVTLCKIEFSYYFRQTANMFVAEQRDFPLTDTSLLHKTNDA